MRRPSVKPTTSGTMYGLLVIATACASVGDADALESEAGDVVKVVAEVVESSAEASTSRRILHGHQKEAIKETRC